MLEPSETSFVVRSAAFRKVCVLVYDPDGMNTIPTSGDTHHCRLPTTHPSLLDVRSVFPVGTSHTQPNPPAPTPHSLLPSGLKSRPDIAFGALNSNSSFF